MKFYSKSKHIIVTALTFFAIFSFVYPSIANAQLESVFYGGVCRPDEQLSIRCWGKSFILGNSVDTALAFACGGENDKEKIWGERAECVPPLEQYVQNLQGDKPRMSGGLMAMSAMAMHSSITEPAVPTNMALFLDDTFNDTIFSSGDTYAQTELENLSEPEPFFQAATFTLWKNSRNIALGLLAVLLGVAGLSILFRSKLSPQVTVTVANVLPYLPLSIIGIVLSYPIITVAYNLLEPLMSVAYNIGMAVFEQLAPTSQIQPELGIYTIIGGIGGLLLTATTWTLAVAAGAVLSFPFVVLMLVALYLVITLFIRFIYEYAKTIVMFVFYVIAFPVISAVAILPGKQNLISLLFKKILANLLALPIMTLLVIVGLGVMASMANPTGDTPGDVQYIAATGAIMGAIIKFAIGFGIISQSFNARRLMEDAFGANGSLVDSFKGGGGSAGGPPGKK